MASKIKIADNPVQPKATFLRKSAFLSTGNTTFKFNFNVSQEKEDNIAHELNNIVEKTEKVDLTENGNTTKSITNDSKDLMKANINKCKFSSSSSDFKFNFDVDRN